MQWPTRLSFLHQRSQLPFPFSLRQFSEKAKPIFSLSLSLKWFPHRYPSIVQIPEFPICFSSYLKEKDSDVFIQRQGYRPDLSPLLLLRFTASYFSIATVRSTSGNLLLSSNLPCGNRKKNKSFKPNFETNLELIDPIQTDPWFLRRFMCYCAYLHNLCNEVRLT